MDIRCKFNISITYKVEQVLNFLRELSVSIIIETLSNFMIENVNQNASRTYQVTRFFGVVVVFIHAIIVVWTAIPLTFCVIFQNVITHKPRC